MAEKQDLELGEAAKGGGKKKLIIIIVAAVLILAIAGGAAVFLMKKKPAPADGEAATSESAEHAEPADHEPEAGAEGETDEDEEHVEGEPSLLYVALPEAIVANLPSETKSRTIKIQVTFAVKNAHAEAAVKKHLPLLGSEVLMLLSATAAEQLMTTEGQQAFRDQALLKVRAAMELEEHKPLVEKILFTQFVMQ